MCTTEILEGFRTEIPEKIVKKFDIQVSDKLIWEIKEDKAIITPIKPHPLMDLSGLITSDVEPLPAEKNG